MEGQVSINLSKEIIDAELMIFNSIGQLFNSQNINTFPFTLDTSNFSDGVYYIALKNENEIYTSKVVIVN